MNKKLVLVALACMALAFTSSAFAQAGNCANGATLQAVIVGSSAQFNTFAYAAEDIITTAAPAGLGTGPYNLFSVKGLGGTAPNQFYTAAIQDVRPTANGALDSATLWVVYDTPTGSNKCNVFAYYSVDSTVGNRAYFAATTTVVGTKTYSTAGVLPCLSGQSAAPCNNTGVALDVAGFCTGKCAQNAVGGQTDTFAAPNDVLPTTVYLALTTPLAPTGTNSPAPYCGQLFAAGSTSAFYCYFNAAATDIRPEDAFYATQRLVTNPVASGMTGLDYQNAACKASGNPTCQIYDSFGQSGTFNALKFNVTGKDPYNTAATVPGYNTLSVGASPLMVLVSENGAGTTTAFNKTVTDANGKTIYLFNDINRKKLAFIFEGNTYCTGDILPAAPLTCTGSNAQLGCGFGSGPALQVVHREMLSGTYNAFEFTGVRMLTGSANGAVTKPTTTSWTSDDDSGQEAYAQAKCPGGVGSSTCEVTSTTLLPYFVDPGAPGMGWTAGTLAAACGGPVASLGGINVVGVPTGAQQCSDPMFISGANFTKPPNCASGNYLSLRSIGTGQEVPDVLGSNNTGAASVKNGIGYAFWSYGNIAKTWSGNKAIGHYLTVDAIDPLFATEGGYYDRTDGQTPNTFPNCDSGTSSSIVLPCTNTIPFTHVYDGTYPLWSMLRVVTFPAVATKTQIPPYVLNLLAFNEQEVNNASHNINDFVPFLTNLANTGTISAPAWKGDLNLGVFRVHYKQGTGAAGVNPGNGHAQCGGVFTGVNIQGGTSAKPACLIDTGSDEGGSVMTVQDDIDFNVDFGGTTTETVALPTTYEEFGLRQ